MKFVAIILVVLNIFLTTIPCDDVNTFDANQIEITAGHSDSDTDKDLDLCTPFCSCNCCSTIVINPTDNQYTSNIEFFYPSLNTNYDALFTSNLLSQVFQPPQV